MMNKYSKFNENKVYRQNVYVSIKRKAKAFLDYFFHPFQHVQNPGKISFHFSLSVVYAIFTINILVLFLGDKHIDLEILPKIK